MHQMLRWAIAVVCQILLSFAMGLLIPFQIYAWTGWDTLWMMPIGLVLGVWLGGWLIWPSTSHQRWVCLLGSGIACALLIIAMVIGIFGVKAPLFWMPLLPLAGFDLLAAWYRHGSSATHQG